MGKLLLALKKHGPIKVKLNSAQRKLLKRLKKKERKEDLNRFAEELNKNLAHSEAWFRKLWEEKGFKINSDYYNKPLNKRIPDVLNERYRYVIEIDGSIHDTQEQKLIDQEKDQYYKVLRFKCFRIKAYDLNRFYEVAHLILELRKCYDKINEIFHSPT